jgi:integrase
VHRVLFSALKQAVRWRLVSTNVAEAVEPPRLRRIEMRTLDAAEVRKLLEAAQGSRLYEVILIAVTTGMRRAEILGLRWADVDFDRSQISVSGVLQVDGSLAEPKTPRSRRDVGMPPTLRDALRSHKARQNEEKLALGAGYVDQGLVFANESGGSWKADGISSLYRGIVKRAGLGPLRFHDLRHTAASLMLEEGLPITTVAAILGHANTSTTLSVYAHAIKGSEQGAAVLMEGILQGTAQGPLNLGGRRDGESRWPNEGQIDPQSSAISEKTL